MQLTYYVAPWDRDQDDAPTGPTVRVDDGVRWGYTLDDIHHLSRLAVHYSCIRAIDFTDRLDAAWGGVVEHLCAAVEAPSWRDLTQAGRSAVDALARTEYRHYGYASRSAYSGAYSSQAFNRYWWTARNTPSPENRVVDELAVRQILPHLTKRQRQALEALAATEDYRAAADIIGSHPDTFRVLIGNARRSFFALWHEGEEPSRVWGTDRRVGRRGQKVETSTRRRPATRAVARRTGRVRRELQHGKASTYTNHACRCDPCTQAATDKARNDRRAKGAKARRLITHADLALARERRAAGETITAIARDLGFANGALSRALRRPIRGTA